MRPTVACCLLLAFALPCQAQPKPNTLTPKEIADGWILLFDGETTFGWTGSGAKVEKGTLVLGGDKSAEFVTTMRFGDYELYFEYDAEGAGIRSIEAVRRKSTDKGVEEHMGTIVSESGGKKTGWRTTTARVEGTSVSSRTAFPNGSKGMGKTSFPKDVPVQSYLMLAAAERATLVIRNLRLRPLNTKSLSNGKDLDGWKEFPGKKSKFAVIDNAINVKDGPGDLQTVGKYKDFVLQLECKSNGKHLNSGVFFRCRDGEYQNGYEAQIHNGFTEIPKKYQIDEYDPKSNKLLGKKEMMFNAIDFGTGAIYRRMPARKQMSKDGEWFTMTVVAHGNHFATWVNGIQVTDWTDNRPKSDNARTGCRLEGGHISIQGHDPTTDLSFRNIRIAELK
jgi:hypothetical protein